MEGATVYSMGKSAKPDDCSEVEYLFGAVGKCWRVNENLIDAVTGVSGSGPAYMYLMLEALMEEGVSNMKTVVNSPFIKLPTYGIFLASTVA
jgi:pyrroline-5-carboxylate reductase